MDLEELAFKNVNELTDLSKEELLMIIALLQQDRKCWIYQFTKTHNNSVDIRSRINKAIEKLELLLKYLKLNQEEEKATGKSYFNTNLFAIRVNEILKILKGGSNE